MGGPIALAILLDAATLLYESFAARGAHTWFDAALAFAGLWALTGDLHNVIAVDLMAASALGPIE